ncbi:MAG: preprotein translocase subunit YajC [Rikenellaceae bacterium]
MINFITAQAEPAAFDFASLIPLLLMGIVVYFFMIRPNQKRQKEITKFRSSLERGSKVVTAGGIYGTIKSVEENTVTMEIANNVVITIDKAMILQNSPAEQK